MDMERWKSVFIFAFLCIMSSISAVHIMVRKCPVTETTWNARSQVVICESPQVYHCIQEERGNLMETCMKAYKVKPSVEGGCPWASYSSKRGSILGGVFYSCDRSGCPHQNDSEYWTNELYKYPICLLDYNETTEITDSTIFPSSVAEITSANNDVNECAGFTIAIVTTVVVLSLIWIVFSWKCRRRLHCRERFCTLIDDNAGDSSLVPVVVENPGSTIPLIYSDESNKSDKRQEIHRNKRYQWNSLGKDKYSPIGIKPDVREAVFKNGRTVVHIACIEGNKTFVKNMINVCVDLLYIKDNNGCTPFHLAGFSGSADLVQYLVDKGGDIRSKDDSGRTIVHNACQAGHINVVKYLIGLNEDVLEIKDNNGITPLHCVEEVGRTIVHHVCERGRLDLVKIFIRIEKAAFEVKDYNGLTPFHFAAFSGSVDLVQYLINNGCDMYCRDNTGQTVAHIACKQDHIHLMKYLIDLDKNILNMEDENGKTPCQCKNKHGWTILHTACCTGDVGLVKHLIEFEKKILNERDKLEMTPFHLAGYSGSIELVQYFLDNGSGMYSKNHYGQTIAHIACGMGCFSLVKYLISTDSGLLKIKEKNGSTPFHYAGLSGSVELAQYLIDNGCDVYGKDSNGRTIVHYACQEGHGNLVKHLVKQCSRVFNIKDKNGLTPFHYAGLSGSVNLAQYLIDIGCDVYSKDNDGRTIVHIGCSKGHVSLVKHLGSIDKGVLCTKDSKGMKPCHYAGLFGSVELMEYLTENGCE